MKNLLLRGGALWLVCALSLISACSKTDTATTTDGPINCNGDNSLCGAGEYCNTSNQCEELPRCTTKAECPSRFRCPDGAGERRCIEGCDGDEDCSSDEYCTNLNVCAKQADRGCKEDSACAVGYKCDKEKSPPECVPSKENCSGDGQCAAYATYVNDGKQYRCEKGAGQTTGTCVPDTCTSDLECKKRAEAAGLPAVAICDGSVCRFNGCERDSDCAVLERASAQRDDDGKLVGSSKKFVCRPHQNSAFTWKVCQEGCQTEKDCSDRGFTNHTCAQDACVKKCNGLSSAKVDCLEDAASNTYMACKPLSGSNYGCVKCTSKSDCGSGTEQCDTVTGLCTEKPDCPTDAVFVDEDTRNEGKSISSESLPFDYQELAVCNNGSGERKFKVYNIQALEYITVTITYAKGTFNGDNLIVNYKGGVSGETSTNYASTMPTVAEDAGTVTKRVTFGYAKFAQPTDTAQLEISIQHSLPTDKAYGLYDIKITKETLAESHCDATSTTRDAGTTLTSLGEKSKGDFTFKPGSEGNKDVLTTGVTNIVKGDLCTNAEQWYSSEPIKIGQTLVYVVYGKKEFFDSVAREEIQLYQDDDTTQKVLEAESEVKVEGSEDLYYREYKLAGQKVGYTPHLVVKMKKDLLLKKIPYAVGYYTQFEACRELGGESNATKESARKVLVTESDTDFKEVTVPSIEDAAKELNDYRVCSDNSDYYYVENLPPFSRVTFKVCQNKVDASGTGTDWGLIFTAWNNSWTQVPRIANDNSSLLGDDKDKYICKEYTVLLKENAPNKHFFHITPGTNFAVHQYKLWVKYQEPSACNSNDDGFRYNQEVTNATELAGDKRVEIGHICDTEKNFYKVEATGSTIQIKLEENVESGHLQVEVYKNKTAVDNGTAAQTIDADTPTSITCEGGSCKGYYLVVAPKKGGVGAASARAWYRLSYATGSQTADIPDGKCWDPLEENQNSSPKAVSNGTWKDLTVCQSKREDFYSVDLEPYEKVCVTTSEARYANSAYSSTTVRTPELSLVDAKVEDSTVNKNNICWTSHKKQTLKYKVTGKNFNSSCSSEDIKGDRCRVFYEMNVEKTSIASSSTCSADANDDHSSALDSFTDGKRYVEGELCPHSGNNDVDWYTVTAPANKELYVTTEYDGKLLDVKTTLADSSGADLSSSDVQSEMIANGTRVGLKNPPGSDTTYKIKVEGKNKSRGSYVLKVYFVDSSSSSSSFPECVDQFEANDEESKATVLAATETEQIHKNLLICGGNDSKLTKTVDQDWFKVTIPGASKLVLKVTAEDKLDVKWKKEGGASLDSLAYNSGGYTLNVTNNDAADATYYVQVLSKSSEKGDYLYALSYKFEYLEGCDAYKGAKNLNVGNEIASATTAIPKLDDQAVIGLCSTKEHYYFLGDSVTSVDAKLNVAHGSSGVTFEVVGEDGSSVSGIDRGEDLSNGLITLKSSSSSYSAGKYYLKVGYDGRMKYKLWYDTNSSASPYCGDEYELNDGSGYASTVKKQYNVQYVTTPILCNVDEDWYTLELENDNYYFGIYGLSGSPDVKLYKKEDATTAVTNGGAWNTTGDAYELTTTTPLNAGTYYLVVKQGSTATTPYRMMVAKAGLFVAKLKSPHCENENSSDAGGIALGAAVVSESDKAMVATLCPGGGTSPTGVSDSADYYKYKVPAGTSTVTIQTNSQMGFKCGVHPSPEQSSSQGKCTISLDNSSGPDGKEMTYFVKDSVGDKDFAYLMIIENN